MASNTASLPRHPRRDYPGPRSARRHAPSISGRARSTAPGRGRAAARCHRTRPGHPRPSDTRGTWRGRAAGAPHNNREDVSIGDLGSGSDYTPFLQHIGVPATDISSEGPYGVYHSAFDNYAWFLQNADPHFVYLQEMARVIGLETIRMADADVLPYDYVTYAREIVGYIETAQHEAADAGLTRLDFAAAEAAQLASSRQPNSQRSANLRHRRSGPAQRRFAPDRDRAAQRQPACPIAPGSGTRSMLPASILATPLGHSRASTKRSRPTMLRAPPSSWPCSPMPWTEPPRPCSQRTEGTFDLQLTRRSESFNQV